LPGPVTRLPHLLHGLTHKRSLIGRNARTDARAFAQASGIDQLGLVLRSGFVLNGTLSRPGTGGRLAYAWACMLLPAAGADPRPCSIPEGLARDGATLALSPEMLSDTSAWYVAFCRTFLQRDVLSFLSHDRPVEQHCFAYTKVATFDGQGLPIFDAILLPRPSQSVLVFSLTVTDGLGSDVSTCNVTLVDQTLVPAVTAMRLGHDGRPTGRFWAIGDSYASLSQSCAKLLQTLQSLSATLTFSCNVSF
jgi:hypothetical protein